MRIRVRSLCITALFTTLLTVGAWITIPITMPPYTMQSFVLYCALWLLKPKQSLGAVALYLLMGAIGLPVFAGFQNGFGVLLGPTSGYLFGFLLMPLVMMLLPKKTTAYRIAFCALGTLCCYTLGTVWYMVGYAGVSWGGFTAAMVQCVLPFILPDAAKLSLATLVCKRMEPLMQRFEK